MKSVRQRQIPYDIASLWTLKYGTNELIYKAEADSQTENRLAVTKGIMGVREGETRSLGLVEANCCA